MKKIILCADDYGQNSAISTGILQLVAQDRLSAVSCFTTLPDWKDFAKEILSYQTKIDIGLHFNLTESNSHFKSIGALILKTHFHGVDLNWVETELNRQLDAFVAEIGRMPAFIDGHQHVHHLPGIREILLKVYNERLRPSHSYIRNTANGFLQALKADICFPKASIIMATGALKLKKQLIKNKIPHNQSFAGIYDFAKAKDYAKIFPYFLTQVNTQGLIMCHPGLKSNDAKDKIAASRWLEYSYFSSEQFLKDCELHNIKLSNFSALTAHATT